MKQGTVFVISIVLCATFLASCKSDDNEKPPTQAVLTSIALTPADPVIAPGTTTQLSAIGSYSNNSKRNITTSVVWNSSDSGIASISNAPGSSGLATAATSTIGSTVITATYSGITGSTTLTASHVASMNVIPPAPSSIAPGTTLQFTAIGTLSDNNSTQQNLTTWATWSSLDAGVADVSDVSTSKGLTRAVAAGTTTITATYDGSSGSAAFKSSPLLSIAVAPLSASIAKGTTQQFTATGTLDDTTEQILTTVATWSSSTASVATISNAPGSQGLAAAAGTGTTAIRATFSSIPSNPAATLTVTPAVITSITVTPANPSIMLGTTQQFIAIATISDLSTQDVSSSVTWNSSDTGVAAISNTSGTKGLATSVDVGSTTITATAGGISSSTKLTVTQAALVSIEITPAAATISLGTNIISQQFIATGRVSDGNTQDLTTSVTWSSSNTNVATISNTPGSQGLATVSFIIIPGTTTITATFSGMTSNSVSLTVNF